MKKVLLAAVVLAGTMSFMSCKKDHTCDCVYTETEHDDGDITVDQSATVETSYTGKYSEKKAVEWCDGYESKLDGVIMGFGIVQETKCVLK